MSGNRKATSSGFTLPSLVSERGVRRGLLRRGIVPWTEIRRVDVYDSSGLRVHLSSGKAYRLEVPLPGPRLVLDRLHCCAPEHTVIRLKPPFPLRQIPFVRSLPIAFVLAAVFIAAYLVLHDPVLFVGAPAGLLAVGYFALRWHRILRGRSTRHPSDPLFVLYSLMLVTPFSVGHLIGRSGQLDPWAFAGCASAFFLVVLPFSYPIRKRLRKLWRERAMAEGLLSPEKAAELDES